MATKTVNVVTEKDLGKGIVKNTATKTFDVAVDGTTIEFDSKGNLAIKEGSIQSGGFSCSDLQALPTRTIDSSDSILIVGSKGCARYAASQSLFSDIKFGLVASSKQVLENDTVNLVYTVSNIGTSKANSLTLKLTNPNNTTITYSTAVIDKYKSGEVTKVSATEYKIIDLQPGGVVSIKVPAKFTAYGSYAFSARVEMGLDVIDVSADDNYGSVSITVGSTKDTSYQETQECPALEVKDKSTGKNLLLINYAEAAKDSSNYSYFEGSRFLNRLNIYKAGTKSITLTVPNSGTAVLNSVEFKSAPDLDAEVKAGNHYISYLNRNSNSGVSYEVGDKRYLLTTLVIDHIFDDKNKYLGQSTHYMYLGINSDRITYTGANTAKVNFTRVNNEYVLDNIPSNGGLFAVSFRPEGSNCTWQTVLICVCHDITDLISEGIRYTLTSGNSSHVLISSNTATITGAKITGFEDITAGVNINSKFVEPTAKLVDKVRINAPLGADNTYVLTVKNGILNPNALSAQGSGNVQVSLNSEGTQVTIKVLKTATATDSFIIDNSGSIIEISVGNGLK